MDKINFKSKYIFPRTSFLVGMGSVLNISGNYYKFNGHQEGWKMDRNAIESDWKMVGKEISQATKKFNKELNKIDKEAIK